MTAEEGQPVDVVKTPVERWRRAVPLFALMALVSVVGIALDLADPAFAAFAFLAALGGYVWGQRLRSAPEQTSAPEKAIVEMPEARPRVDSAVEAVVSALPEPALLLTPEGDILTANERVALSVGIARVGDPLSFLVRVPEVLEAVRSAARDDLPRRVEFGERVPLDRWLEAHVVPLHLMAPPAGAGAAAAAQGAPDAVLLTFRDLTQQRRVEQMRADFVANASHELRTPLASLSGFIETLMGPARNDPAARDRFLGIMGAQARRMSRLIDDLLSLSRIELNAHVRPEVQVELGTIVAHVCEALAPLAHERGVEIHVTRPDEPACVLGERDELIRLIENLVENAMKYGASGKRVDVAVEIEKSGEAPLIVLAVRDYGPGIPPEHLPRLTERFYRVDIAASREQGGTGLGLAIVKHIVARHRGRLTIESRPADGAIFTVRFDRATESTKKHNISKH
ncbi:ATP-binding protein [Aquabacter spiritensis]|uniref:histidine kinase n=1 Tax=Aquabacter spiritensis TaxID=933073 RepID=A0A4R3M5G4_9HYPH|nr:ATP-binding protein [Aquabacter spiritensis]TCT08262.1 two-component system phosphate regulon sensor histidine kinase PhoR [Aquabacter spiritensis]